MDDTTPDPWGAPADGATQPAAPFLPPPAPATHLQPPRAPGSPAFPGIDAPTTSVVVPEPPKKSRKGLIGVAAVVALLGIGVGAFFVFRGGDDGTAFALEAAVSNAASAPGSTSHVTMSTMGQKISMDSEIDNEKKLVHLSMDLGAALGADGAIEAVVDSANSVVYLGSDILGQLGGGGDSKWVKMDRTAIEAAGQDASFFDQLNLNSTVDPAAVFDKAKSVTDKGFADVDGEKVKHYEVTVSIADVTAMNPSLKTQLDQLGADLPDDVVYDMYVTEANEIRRITFELALGPVSISIDAVQHLLTTAPDIQLPDPADVTDIGDLLG